MERARLVIVVFTGAFLAGACNAILGFEDLHVADGPADASRSDGGGGKDADAQSDGPPTTDAGPGALDPTFGDGGIAAAVVDSPSTVVSLHVEGDGSIATAGVAGATSRLFVARVGANGTLASAPVLPTTPATYAWSTASVLAGGATLAGGTDNLGGSDPFVVARYAAAGTLETGFGNPTNGGLADAVLQTTGGVFAAGANADDFLVVGYGLGGGAPLWQKSADFGASDEARAIVAQGTKIVVVGESGPSPNNIVLTRLDPAANGSKDTSFGTNGQAKLSVCSANGCKVHGALLQPDSSILIVGGDPWTVWRVTANGSLDATFSVPSGSGDFARGMALSPDGKIVVVGGLHVSGTMHMAIARLDANGAMDATFGGNGIAVLPPGELRAVALAPDGRIIAGGATGEGAAASFVVVRVLP